MARRPRRLRVRRPRVRRRRRREKSRTQRGWCGESGLSRKAAGRRLLKTRFTRRENQDDGVRFRRRRRRRADALPARPGESERREEPERDPSQSDK